MPDRVKQVDLREVNFHAHLPDEHFTQPNQK